MVCVARLPVLNSRRFQGKQTFAHCGSAELAEKCVGTFSVHGRYHLKQGHHFEDDYELVDSVLGTGLNGQVRLAISKSPDLKERFAVKAFRLASLPPKKRDELMSEVEVFLSMDHPHIGRLYDVYDADSVLYLVMECCEGGELFDRVQQRKQYAEWDAIEATKQMLLALNYLHCHGIAHCDVKLENFLYDSKAGDNLKLIDFGFSKFCGSNIKMHVGCGTLSYVAPEVLQKSYTKQCDMWSLGVISFILLAGYMPFSGSEVSLQNNILNGRYHMKPDRWKGVSQTAKDFVQSLLQVNPDIRLTAGEALRHPWIASNNTKPNVEIDASVVEGLREFCAASKFRRCCMELMAWSLSTEERARIQGYFEAMDVGQRGTITLQELKSVMTDKFHVPEGEAVKVFTALTSYHDESIHYTDFLAAMLDKRIAMHDGLIRAAFKRFDSDNSGYITLKDLHEVVGDQFEGESVEKMLAELDVSKHNKVSYEEFVDYLRGDQGRLERIKSSELIDKVIESELNRRPSLKESISKNLSLGASQVRPHLEWRKVVRRSPVAPPGCCSAGSSEQTSEVSSNHRVVRLGEHDVPNHQPQCCVIS